MLAKICKSFVYRRFSKRVVHDHLIEQKMRKMMYKPDPAEENTSEPEDIENFEDYRANVLHKADSVSKKYDKKIDKDPADIKDHDYHYLAKEYDKNVNDYFKNDNYKLDPFNEIRKEKTSRLLRSIKTNSAFDFVREKNLNKVTDEYNNYSKFERNYAYLTDNQKNEKLDKGIINMSSKISEYVSKINPMGNIDDSLRTSLKFTDAAGKSISQDAYEELMNDDEGLDQQLLNAEEDIIDSSENHFGRLSPHAREEIYEFYNNGWSVKDISLKYGIMPARTVAIIWCRRYFYDVVAPLFGRTFWRLGIEREFSYAQEYPFVDYGIDVEIMAHFDKGLDYVTFGNTTVDINPPQEVKDKIKNAVKKLPKRRAYTISKGFVGTGFRKYEIKDIVIRKGNGKLDVSEMFKRICYRGDLTPYSFPKKVRERLELGPRIASLGYRVGPRSNRPIRFYNEAYHSQ